MRRVLSASVVLAALTALVPGSFSAFTDTASNSMSLGTNPTFDPITLTAPVVSGSVTVNGTLQVSTPGSYRSNVSVTRSYQWQVCTSTVTSTCTNIALATSSSYGLGATLLGTHFRVVETADNGYGAVTSASAIVQ